MLTVTLTFRDPNMPKMHEKCTTLEAARSTLHHWARNFAGIKALKIDDPANHDTHIFGPSGGYLLTAHHCQEGE